MMSNNMIIRPVVVSDAVALVDVVKRIDAETPFLLRKPGELKTTPEEQLKKIEAVLAKPNQMVFVAEDKGVIVGYLMCLGGSFKMTQKTATVIIGILQSHVGQGVGTQLFKAMEEWAKNVGIHRLELHVDEGNDRGKALYQKMGFIFEGTRKDATYMNGQYVDSYMMAKIIN